MKVTIGIIGFGYMGYYHYKKIIPKTDDFQVLAAYDVDASMLDFVKRLLLVSYYILDEFLNYY